MILQLNFKEELIPLYIIGLIWFFYVQFAGAISVYRLAIQKKLNTINLIGYAPYLLFFFLVDIFLNWTVLLIIGIPPKGCTTMSDRFQVYHLNTNLDGTPFSANQFQRSFGTFICEKLLNPIDPTGNHC